MKQPKPIKTTLGVGDLTHQIELNVRGFRTKYKPYLTVDCITNGNLMAGGFIEDRDLRRLKRWVDDCLKTHRRKRK